LVRTSARVRNRGIVDQDVETSELVMDAIGCRINGNLIRHVELNCKGTRSNLRGCGLTTFGISRPDEHRKAVCHKFLGDLKADSLAGSGNEGNRFLLHLFSSWGTRVDGFRDQRRVPH
jgi:hypothetical protein